MKAFGDFIKNKREQLGIPQRKIAFKLDIDTSTLSKIERNERAVTVAMLSIISDELKIDLDIIEYEFLKHKISNDFKGIKSLKINLLKISNEI
jgi:transcriptional regulator with XRE-family HTH domain